MPLGIAERLTYFPFRVRPGSFGIKSCPISKRIAHSFFETLPKARADLCSYLIWDEEPLQGGDMAAQAGQSVGMTGLDRKPPGGFPRFSIGVDCGVLGRPEGAQPGNSRRQARMPRAQRRPPRSQPRSPCSP